MGYYFAPHNKKIEGFHMGAFSWPYLLDHAGLVWPVVFRGPRWYQVTGLDPRIVGTYPRPLTNDGFRVFAEEARHLARVAENLAGMNEFLRAEDPEFHTRDLRYIDGVMYLAEEPLFETFRDDWTELYYKFAEWANQSSGFKVR